MTPNRILFIAEGQLGDLLILTPAIRAVKNTYPDSRIGVLIFQRRSYFRNSEPSTIFNESPANGAAAVFRHNPHVSDVYEVDLQTLRDLNPLARVKAEIEIMVRLRKKRFDTVVVFPRDRFVVWAYASGAERRAGQLRQVYHQLLTHKPDIQKRDEGVIMYYCRLVSALGASVDSYNTEFHFDSEASAFADDFLNAHNLNTATTLIAIHPGSFGDDRRWPPERFAELIDILQANTSTRVLLCGTLHEAEVLTAIHSASTTKPVIADTSGGLYHLGALLQRCTLFVGNDSGPWHLAAAVGTPTVAMLTRNKEEEWGVYHDKSRHIVLQGHDPCPACSEGDCTKAMPPGERYGCYCIRMISVAEVAERIRAMVVA